jgi:hypothetical protein
MEYTENKFFLPFVIVTTFVFLIILSVINSVNSVLFGEHTRIITISTIIWFIWLALFIIEMIKGAKIAERKELFIIKSLFAVIISFYFANTIWFSGYLTLNPADAVLNGKIHRDTVFLASIAESIKNYGYPSILLNNAGFIHYHFGSNIIMALLSIIFNVSVLNTYNYIYPIIFIPIYSYLIISVVIEIRKYKKEKTQLSVIDYIFLSFFFIGFIPTAILDQIGIWKSSWIISESYLLALIFSLLYIYLFFKFLINNKQKNLLFLLLTSLFIFICSSMKISVGFLLLTGIIYMIFRKYTKILSYWIINIIFLIIFVISYMIFSGIQGGVGATNFQLFSFARHFTNNVFGFNGIILHYFFLLFFTLFFLYYQLSVNTPPPPIKYALSSKRLIIEETLVMVSVVSLLAGLLLNIGGGSAAYFSYFQELIAICMLLGYNIFGNLQKKIQTESFVIRHSIVFFIFLLSLVVLGNARPMYSLYKVMKEQNNTSTSTLLNNTETITKIPLNEKREYCIFLDDSAEIWDSYKHNAEAAIFFYPALTGIRVLNGFYTDGKDIFFGNGTYLQNIESTTNLYYTDISFVTESKLTLDKAKEKAKKKLFKYIIYFYDDKYKIIEI